MSPPPISQPFLDAMSRLANSVAITTTDGTAGKAGATISTLSPVSAEKPPSLLICLHHKTTLAQKIQHNKTFAVNILKETQEHLAQLFAGQNSPTRGQDKFDRTQNLWQQTKNNNWKLRDALAVFDCELTKAVRCQSHIVVIGTVLELELDDGTTPPLLYANRSYRMLLGGRTVPVTSTSPTRS